MDSRFHRDCRCRPVLSRREALQRCGLGLGGLALAALLRETGLAAPDGGDGSSDPLAQRSPHFAPRATRVIHLFMDGGPSHVDTFDPKPELARRAGQPLPESIANDVPGTLFPSPFAFGKHGQSGLAISEIFPRLAACADRLCVIRAMHTSDPNHETASRMLHTGDARLVRPSLGAWVLYGLGSENHNLPAFVTLAPGPFPESARRAAFLPPVYQGTVLDTSKGAAEMIGYLRNPQADTHAQRQQLDLLAALERPRSDPLVDARIQTFETAFRMQVDAEEAFDVAREPEPMRALYGDNDQGRRLLLARRLVERGVRFIQVAVGDGSWDSHANLAQAHRDLAASCDRAIAALLVDLEQRGLLDETLVICGGEFGRLPTMEPSSDYSQGRGHNHRGFSVWLAGGGVQGGLAYGATDPFGLAAVENRVHVHDLHATILHLLGFDHQRLTYRHAGRDFRLTDVHGRVVHDVLA
jgi:hypothetical protein